MPASQPPLPPFSPPYAPDDRAIAARLLPAARLGAAREQRIDHAATRLIEAIRTNDDPLGGVEDMLREFALSTKEGLALMVLAEALLRVPDARTGGAGRDPAGDAADGQPFRARRNHRSRARTGAAEFRAAPALFLRHARRS